MALNPTTPGVYIQEIPVLPASVVPVATAIPGFIGYTEKAIINGLQWTYPNSGDPAPPVRITSLLEYQQVFGGADNDIFSVAITNPALPALPQLTSITHTTASKFSLYYHMQMYFANGGGPCWVISVGDYAPSTGTITDLIKGVAKAAEVDEITLLLAPEANDASGTYSSLASAMLSQCNALQDRFTIFDVKRNPSNTALQDADAFRSTTGANYLKYGAAYYPSLNTSIIPAYNESAVTITGNANYSNLAQLQGRVASGTITIGAGTLTVADTVTISYGTGPTTNTRVAVTDFTDATTLAAAINANATWSAKVVATSSGNIVTLTAKETGSAGTFTLASAGTIITTATIAGINPLLSLYAQITQQLQENYLLTLYPSSSIAGVYASVDRDRGVWKAPANVSLAGVITPSLTISGEEQEPLNVDATSGKSVNAIRTFAGKGVLVWGGRTLAGNDNEWRYVNVRRLFIMAEESIKKATEFVVFEPNDANTWTRTKSMIINFLTNLWSDGALVGAKPEQAFFVKVGLGETMTAQDILEGKMIIQIGMAASRPAEFIILQFMHKLQES